MKKCVLLVLGAALIGFMASCASSSGGASQPPAPQRDPNIPEWLDEIAPEDVLWGVGIAKQSSENFSRTTAENRARVAIARELDFSVKAMFTDYNRDAGTANNQANLSLQEDVSRSITNARLNGTTVNRQWKAPDGTWWYRVEYKKADAKNALADIFTSEAAQYAEFKTDQALQMMDKELEKSSGKPPMQVKE
jgi:hypothetical protein